MRFFKSQGRDPMKHRKVYNLVYAITMVLILGFFLLPFQNDMVDMLLGILAIILTSIFTYTNRHDFPRKRRSDND